MHPGPGSSRRPCRDRHARVPGRIKESGNSPGDRQLVLVGNKELGGEPEPEEVLQLIKRYPLRVTAGSKRVPGCAGVQCANQLR
jgi:hypothetical protein